MEKKRMLKLKKTTYILKKVSAAEKPSKIPVLIKPVTSSYVHRKEKVSIGTCTFSLHESVSVGTCTPPLPEMLTRGTCTLPVMAMSRGTSISARRMSSPRMKENESTLSSIEEFPECETQIIKLETELQMSKCLFEAMESKLIKSKNMVEEEKLLRQKAEEEIIQKDIQATELTTKIKLLEEQFETFKSLQGSAEKLACCETENDRLKAELEASRNEINLLKVTLKEAEQALAQANCETQQKADDVQAAQNMMDEILTKNKVECSLFLREKLKDITKVKDALNKLKIEKKTLEDNVQDMNTKCEELVELQRNLEQAQKKVQQVEAEIGQICEISEKKNSDIEKLKLEVSVAYNSLQVREEKADRAKKLLKERDVAINELKVELKKQKEIIDNIFQTLSHKSLQVIDQEKKIKLLEEANDATKKLLGDREEKIEKLKQKIEYFKKKISECRIPFFATVPIPNDSKNPSNEISHKGAGDETKKH